MYGTASTVRAFVLVETPGPWGTDALRDARLSPTVASHLRRARVQGVRPLLVRRHGRSVPTRSTVLAAHADPHHPWLEVAQLDDPEQLLDIEFGALAAGESLGWERTEEPVFLTCTHGRHDRCCAERGRPVAAALARSHPAESWEVSHIGGDRFAGNLLVLPDGLYYGRLEPEAATELATRHRAGDLDLAHLRGRCGHGFAVQAAEWFLRSELAVTASRAVRLTARASHGQQTEATFEVEQRRWRVRVVQVQAAAQLLTCAARRPDPIPVHELVSIGLAGGSQQ